MNILPSALEALIAELGKLPGVGRRSAERLAFHLLRTDEEKAMGLAEAIGRARQSVSTCLTCHFLTQDEHCPLCSDPRRDDASLCVVEQAQDVIAFEKAGGFRGRYHVLGGRLSPLKGITPEDLWLPDLFERIRAWPVSLDELILATSPSVEGDATSLYIQQVLAGMPCRMTRLGRGVPMGGALDSADPTTLRAALESRSLLQ